MNKQVYFFGEGSKADADLLGGKGANLNEMTRLKIPVPPGFTITTEVCNEYLENRNRWPDGLAESVKHHMERLEDAMGKEFGGKRVPLLVSVRSGAKISMPGMMDTVLNLGLNDETVERLIAGSGNERFGWDAYRRFIQMFSNVVLGMDMEAFDEILEAGKHEAHAEFDNDLSADELRVIVKAYKDHVSHHLGHPFPDNPEKQLKMAINAVFDSWNTPRAISYRTIHGIDHHWGTAVNVQAMVFGNMGQTSGTGVAFTRNPSTGERKFYGEFLMNAQGEDVVAGIRTPEPIEKLANIMPAAYKQLVGIYETLEKHYKDMQDIEFTIENGTLYMLQTRRGKRTAKAAVRMAVEMVEEGLIDKKAALKRLDAAQLDQMLHPSLAPNHDKPVIARGLPASPGAAGGKVVFDSKAAAEMGQKGEKVILVRKETSPDDIEGMHFAKGILTATGGMTSHAAVVARGMNKCCVSGCSDIVVNGRARKFVTHEGREVHEGEFITLDGTTGEVILGEVPTIKAELDGHFETVLSWADEHAKLVVRANADTPKDAEVAFKFGAKGIGLCRTEHMFFESGRIPVMQEMILAGSKEERVKALNKLEVMQTEDFRGIFKAMNGNPCTVRLLDPPLHEFLPHKDADIEALAQKAGLTFEKLKDIIVSLTEVNPMLGHRGCRLMITYPEITEMQTRAIITAACDLVEKKIEVNPEIMIPLVGTLEEFTLISKDIHAVAERILAERKVDLKYRVGTMIEIPRACLRAKDIAKQADFFSFGTNDLTQMTFGYSRDDAGKFIGDYLEAGILKRDPFVSIDVKGVGELVKMCVHGGRKSAPKMKMGVCGEHGGDPDSINFFHGVGLNYVSCSPYRVPIARIAAAQANL
ncbi:MAG: pyruvate, phosphate dikinase [Patescibacteria group bacterium]